MMFLFFQLLFWLLLAGVLGFAAGWFLQARRAGKRLAEHRERYRQHIQRLEQGLADVAEDEPYAKERRDPIEVSEDPVSFLSGAEEAEQRRREMRNDESLPAQAESSGVQSGQTVTLTPAQDDTAAASEVYFTREAEPNDAAVEASVDNVVDEPNAALASAPAEWDGRLQSCESSIQALQQRLGRLERQCRAQSTDTQPKPLEKAAAAMSAANQTAVKPFAEPSAGFKPYGMEAPDGEPDDLKRIWGVGPKLEGMLNDMGIFHFRQIASFSAEDIENVSAKLDQFADRVKRDDWVSQASKLMAEEQ